MVADQTFYEVAVSRLDEQVQRANALDGKVSSVFGFSAAILPVFGALLALTRKDRPECVVILYLIAIGVYMVMLVFTFRSYRITKWSLRPELETLQAHSASYSDVAMRLWVANECLLSIKANESRLHKKARMTAWAIRLLTVDVFLLALAAFLTIR